MYNSGITVQAFIDSIIEEADISAEIPRASWLRWLSAVEQFAYTEILREYVSTTLHLDNVTTDVFPLMNLDVPHGAAPPVYDDVIRVYDENGHEIQKGGAASAQEFPDKSLYSTDYRGNLILHTFYEQAECTIIYRIRPEIKTEDNEGTLHVALPTEYLDMAAAKMRGEAYKVANEDGIAAKWLADYNLQVENFKVWSAARNERFGI